MPDLELFHSYEDSSPVLTPLWVTRRYAHGRERSVAGQSEGPELDCKGQRSGGSVN